MKRLIALALAVCALCACAPDTSSAPSSAASHSVTLALYDQESYTPSGKYTELHFGQGDAAEAAEFDCPVPGFLTAEQQEAYVDAMTLWRAFTVETGFDLSNNRMYELAGKTYYRDLGYDTYADFADHLRTRFSYELYNTLRTVTVQREPREDAGLALGGYSPYIEWDTRLYVLPAQAQNADECPWPDSFAQDEQTDDAVSFFAEYPGGGSTRLTMRRTDTGWQFTEFSSPYHLT